MACLPDPGVRDGYTPMCSLNPRDRQALSCAAVERCWVLIVIPVSAGVSRMKQTGVELSLPSFRTEYRRMGHPPGWRSGD
jgi:hypothetical protein